MSCGGRHAGQLDSKEDYTHDFIFPAEMVIMKKMVARAKAE